jgi:hypothetical protein
MVQKPILASALYFARISAIVIKLARLLLYVLQAAQRPKPRGKKMQKLNQTETQPTGTIVGASISMLLLIAFGLSSFVIQQKDASHHAAEQSNRPVGVSAYLA